MTCKTTPPIYNNSGWIPSLSDSSGLWSHLHPSPRQANVYLVYASVVDRVCFSQQSFYDFRYDDEDTVMNEIDEFYSYVEMPQVAENLKAWQGSFPGGTLVSSMIARVHGILPFFQNGQAPKLQTHREGPMSSYSWKASSTVTPKSDSPTPAASFTCFKVHFFHTCPQTIHLCHVTIRHICRNNISGAPAPLDL